MTARYSDTNWRYKDGCCEALLPAPGAPAMLLALLALLPLPLIMLSWLIALKACPAAALTVVAASQAAASTDEPRLIADEPAGACMTPRLGPASGGCRACLGLGPRSGPAQPPAMLNQLSMAAPKTLTTPTSPANLSAIAPATARPTMAASGCEGVAVGCWALVRIHAQ